MAIDPVTAIFETGKTILDKFVLDADKKADRLARLEELRQSGDLALLEAEVKMMLAQLEINKTEAGNANLFIAGWRPMIGWTGGLALAYQFVVYPILQWLPFDEPPVLDAGPLFAMVTALLGVGTMRSYDKLKGTDTKRI